ncbi:hypothetical protein K437DRAFT_254252 [Tilletiaria anomala UBC 951]|uniref:Potassium channel domain-containing protein n=1 Tax=Tilletiaria anomala (strain ATCC 24038 / CBS 436.72 / UBC 951) TaxID=1037660 RepID=A0A066WPC0_TILAU|nr:uncharacterized protein K437DRAFT_254252 [Tilletiaria anomala UBC 951]KDN52470.1 hypothetical protein K437DRAFT_254252 [Tilletiaria anomala UBC 951]
MVLPGTFFAPRNSSGSDEEELRKDRAAWNQKPVDADLEQKLQQISAFRERLAREKRLGAVSSSSLSAANSTSSIPAGRTTLQAGTRRGEQHHEDRRRRSTLDSDQDHGLEHASSSSRPTSKLDVRSSSSERRDADVRPSAPTLMVTSLSPPAAEAPSSPPTLGARRRSSNFQLPKLKTRDFAFHPSSQRSTAFGEAQCSNPLSITRTISFKDAKPTPSRLRGSMGHSHHDDHARAYNGRDDDDALHTPYNARTLHANLSSAGISSSSRYRPRGSGRGTLSAWPSHADPVSPFSTDTDGESTMDEDGAGVGTGKFHLHIGFLERLRERRRRLHEEDERQVAHAAKIAAVGATSTIGEKGSEHGPGGEEGRAVTAEGRLEEIEEFALRIYRKTPIFSGVMAPFAIMLEVPGLTSKWYVRTPTPGISVVYQDNPALLDVGLAISMGSAIIANIFIILRFLELLRPRFSTVVAVIFLTFHDIINVMALSIFGVIHAVGDGFTYSESFYMTLGSTVASIMVNVTLIIDFISTKNFGNAGSGLTQKQKELVIMAMVFLVYLSLGSLLYALILGDRFENSLYFVLCTITSVGFGDMLPATLASKIILFFYAPVGIVLVALVIATARQTILESFEKTYKKRRTEFRRRYEDKQRARKDNRRQNKTLRWLYRGRGAKPISSSGGIGGGENQDSTGKSRVTPGFSFRGSPASLRKKTMTLLSSPFFTRRFVEEQDKQYQTVDKQTHTSERSDPRPGHEAHKSTKATTPSKSSSADEKDVRGTSSSSSAKKASAEGPSADKAAEGTTEAQVNFQVLHTEAEQAPRAFANSTQSMTLVATENTPLAEVDTSVDGVDSNEEDKAGDTEPAREEDKEMHSHDGFAEAELDEMEKELKKQREELEANWKAYKAKIIETERTEFYAKLSVAASLFFLFWTIGALVFMFTEGFDYFTAFYFCWVTMMTIGYGDFTARSPPGRAFFIIWMLFGIGILTVVFAIIGDAWGSMYHKTIMKGSKRQAVTKSRQRQRLHKLAMSRQHSPMTGSGRAPMTPTTSTTAHASADIEKSPKALESRNTLISAQHSAPALHQRLDEHLAEQRLHAGHENVPDHELEGLALGLARAGMALHEHASRFMLEQRHSLQAALSKLPNWHDFVPERRVQYSREQLHECVLVAESIGDPTSIQAAQQLLTMHQLEEQLTLVVKNAHVMTDTLSRQQQEISDLQAKMADSAAGSASSPSTPTSDPNVRTPQAEETSEFVA